MIYSAKVRQFLRGESPHRVRLSQPPVSSVAFAAEDANPNKADEAYTENHAGRKGERTSLKRFSLVTTVYAVGEGVNKPKANTEEPNMARFPRGCRGPRAWHVWREMSGTWEAFWIPA